MSRDKASQMFRTLQILAKKYPEILIRYIYLAPAEPSRKTQELFQKALQVPGTKNVIFIWKVIRGPGSKEA